jgi:XTP/dITP diphosphohydrolase
MKMKILIATTNPGKFSELRKFLSDLPYEYVSLSDIGISLNVEETGNTFDENAILKAKTYADLSGLPAIADDGGFEIDILHGEPGVKSHRWISGDAEDSDEDLIAYTLKRLEGIQESKRGAQLRLVLAFALPHGRVVSSEASIRGVVAETPSQSRTQGFPYRALLYLPELGKFYDNSVLTEEETNLLNHRK